jgi:hypothetical protein
VHPALLWGTTSQKTGALLTTINHHKKKTNIIENWRGSGCIVMAKPKRKISKRNAEGEDRVENSGSRGHGKTNKRGKMILGENTDSDDGSKGNSENEKNHGHPTCFHVPPKPGQEGDGMSLTNVDQERWRMMEVRRWMMEERATREEDDEGSTMVSGVVAAKAFPNWKFMFKKDNLGSRVISAVAKSHMTVSPRFEGRKLAELHGGTVRACLDGCKANTRAAARKRCMGEQKSMTV